MLVADTLPAEMAGPLPVFVTDRIELALEPVNVNGTLIPAAVTAPGASFAEVTAPLASWLVPTPAGAIPSVTLKLAT